MSTRIFTLSEKDVKTTEDELHGSEAFPEFHQLLDFFVSLICSLHITAAMNA